MCSGRAQNDVRHLLRRFAHFVDVQHHHSARRTVEPVDDVVETRGEKVNVFAIDRRDEALVDANVDRVRELIGEVLDVLDLLHEFRGPLRLREQLIEELRRGAKVLGKLVEQARKTLRRAG